MTTLFEDKAVKYVPRLMEDLELTREQACGIFGNLGTECAGFTKLQEIKPTVKGSRGGYGWMQWTGPRRRAYEAWCSSNHLTPSDDESNYKYLVKESLTEELPSIRALHNCNNVTDATETFMKLNLRPGTPNLASRVKYADSAYSATGNLTLSPIRKPVEPVVKPTPKVLPHVSTQGGVIATGGTIATVTPYHYLPYILGATAIVMVAGYLLVRYYQYKHNG